MNYEQMLFASQTIDIAETDLYLELTNRMCYYDDKNLNNVCLPYKGFEEFALECAKTLINMPVQAKYKKIAGQDDLGSHEMRVDKNGEVTFNTESVGTHTDVWIEESEVTTVSGETRVLPCLYAKKRIWKRNKNLINAIKRLYDSSGGLGSSWEIKTIEYTYKDGVKTLTNYVFMSDCLLGSTTTPAYSGTSKAISLSALSEQELMVAEALSADLLENQGQAFGINDNTEKEEDILKKDKNTDTSTEEQVPEVTDSGKASVDNETNISTDTDTSEGVDTNNGAADNDSTTTDTSALTSYDLRKKISKACRDKYDDWCWVTYLFPEDHEVWCEYDGESELDYLKFTYSVENDEVTVSEPEKVSLTVSVKNVNSTIAEYEKTIAEKDELIVNASSEITSLKAENTELSQYKEKFTQMEQAQLEEELQQKKKELIASVVKSGQITAEEIEKSEELSGYVDSLDKKSLMAIVGERLSASVGNKTDDVETSEINKDNTHISSNLNNEDDETVDMASIMRGYLRK